MPGLGIVRIDKMLRHVPYVLAALGAAVVLSLAWAQFRGFDMLDGAYYFLLYQNPADNPDTTTRFHLLARPIWLLCGQNIVAFRFTCIGLATIATWSFWRAFKCLLPSPSPDDVPWWPLWLATIAGLTWVPVALTYNSIATILSLFLFGVIFGPSVATGSGRWRYCLKGLFLATVTLGLFLAKPPAAVATCAACYFLLCFDRRLRRWERRLLLAGVILVLVTAAAGATFLVTRPGFSASKYFYVAGAPISILWVKRLIIRYASEVGMILPAMQKDLLWVIGPAILACAAWIFTSRASLKTSRWLPASLVLFLAASLGALFARQLWDGSFSAAVSGNASRFYLILWCSLIPVWLCCCLRPTNLDRPDFKKHLPWIIVFFALPLISSIGSTNTIYVTARHETVFWSAGLLLLANLIATAYSAQWFKAGIGGLLSLGAVGSIFSGHFLHPYMFQPSLWRQTAAIEIGVPSTRLRVDPALASFLREVRSSLDANGYKAGDDVFGFFNLPGVIYAIGAKEPGAPWYFGTWYHDDEADGAKLRLVPLARRQSAWIITQDDLSRFRRQFLYFNIDFPNGYTRIWHTINPITGLEVGIWKPRGRR
jgi:hypothetical protein